VRRVGTIDPETFGVRRQIPSEGRRSAALKERQRRKRSVLDSLVTEEIEATDLRQRRRPERQNLREGYKRLLRAERQRGKNEPILRARAAGGLRKAGTRDADYAGSHLLCVRRGGLLLITCLLEFGIEISDRTVDHETMEIWTRYKEEQGLDLSL